MLDTRPLLMVSDFPEIHRKTLDTLQINLGYKCNLSCTHCHVAAGPNRKELMSKEVVDEILQYMQLKSVGIIDLTGGAPEMNPHFKYLVREARKLGAKVIDRCNLTILLEEGYEDMAEFLAEHQVEIVASLPCYAEQNVDKQRGKGVYHESIEALKKLNILGYGKEGSGLTLNLVYNPGGPFLPPPQEALENDYKRELFQQHGIVFNQLFALTNMPISRFGSFLMSKGQFNEYMGVLKDSYSEHNLDALMCKSLISIDWEGYVYDCDFNQMLHIPLIASDKPKVRLHELFDLDLNGKPIAVADHCYGCTAGQGSSCGGALD
ncbi:arsenosugar biosynthesis radical SAM (seleno)protein ArsS [Hahella ganghwensis]|uniref:arsenosugar biosynthesis radical SAM (seleno)protein ArsS n=1 Tax=Hahella ganghwensis TaxID=286420 RepID=UPI0003734622|nr:arsenosugar biosynthesis radical SAM (seleno)protein ArsS [Hahella ganghwensis]